MPLQKLELTMLRAFCFSILAVLAVFGGIIPGSIGGSLEVGWANTVEQHALDSGVKGSTASENKTGNSDEEIDDIYDPFGEDDDSDETVNQPVPLISLPPVPESQDAASLLKYLEYLSTYKPKYSNKYNIENKQRAQYLKDCAEAGNKTFQTICGDKSASDEQRFWAGIAVIDIFCKLTINEQDFTLFDPAYSAMETLKGKLLDDSKKTQIIEYYLKNKVELRYHCNDFCKLNIDNNPNAEQYQATVAQGFEKDLILLDGILSRNGNDISSDLADIVVKYAYWYEKHQERLYTLLSKGKQEPVAATGRLYLGVLRRSDDSIVNTPLKIGGIFTDGSVYKEQDYTGKSVLVIFWTPWSRISRKELDFFKNMYRQYKDKGLEIISVCCDNDEEKMNSYLRKNPLPWKQMRDSQTSVEGQRMSEYYGINQVPAMLQSDTKGNICLSPLRTIFDNTRYREVMDFLLFDKPISKDIEMINFYLRSKNMPTEALIPLSFPASVRFRNLNLVGGVDECESFSCELLRSPVEIDQLQTRIKEFRSRIAQADSIRIGNEIKRVEITDKAAIEELNRLLDFQIYPQLRHCMCDGNSQIYWYVHNKPVACCSIHHFISVRWKSIYESDENKFDEKMKAGFMTSDNIGRANYYLPFKTRLDIGNWLSKYPIDTPDFTPEIKAALLKRVKEEGNK